MTEEIAILKHRTPNTKPQDCLKFSIIVPVYNCEKYITKCLDSLIHQDITSRNYELVITDDGSTDQTPQILDAYAEKFPFIHVTHTQNFGPSHARNVALAQCRGEYITFCDGDDVVSPQLMSVLSCAVKRYADAGIIIFGYLKYYDDFSADGWPVYDVEKIVREGRYYNSEAIAWRTTGTTGDERIGSYLWNKVFLREFVEGIAFDESLMIGEDQKWLLEIFAARQEIKSVFLEKCILYCYVQHDNSGLTRETSRSYSRHGFMLMTIAHRKELKIKNLSPSAAEKTECKIYHDAVNRLYGRHIHMSPSVIRTLKMYSRKYACRFYTSPTYSTYRKLKAAVKHVLLIMGIHT